MVMHDSRIHPLNDLPVEQPTVSDTVLIVYVWRIPLRREIASLLPVIYGDA